MTGFHDPHVDPLTHARIENELTTIERENGVRILLAVESGSRAWRFPSQDSDYDVRFLYLQPVEAYLSVLPRRDVIERPVDAVLDVNGWDLRKALQLLLRSNAVLLEWLASPIRYRTDEPAVARLAQLARATADSGSLAYHYQHQAQRSFDQVTGSPGEVRLKIYFYALRAALALLWLNRRREPPPMDLPALMADFRNGEIASVVDDLVARKAGGTEDAMTPRVPVLDRLIGQGLSVSIPPRGTTVDRPQTIVDADALFASLVLAG